MPRFFMVNPAALARDTGLVLLYHAAFESPPRELSTGLHNVRPSVIARQLEMLSEAFQFVDVDTFASLEDPRGHAAVTFDDGYRCVFDEALPAFESLGIPFTVYLNGANFEGGVFWRDKVRLLENRGLVAEFEAFMQGIDPEPGMRFYRYSKLPRVNSRVVDEEIDRFLAARGLAASQPSYCVDALDALPSHPLVSYGNHSHRHYVLSSLDADTQREEIGRTQNLLRQLDGHRISSLFAVPFGEARDFDSATAAVLRDAGYQSVLMSRNRLHRETASVHGMPAIERFMPPDRDEGFVTPEGARGAVA